MFLGGVDGSYGDKMEAGGGGSRCFVARASALRVNMCKCKY